MALDWYVVPSTPTRWPVLLGAAYQPYYGGASFTNDNRESAGRLTVYPAFVWTQRGLHASAQQATAQSRVIFAPAPVQVWKTIFPDVLLRSWRPQGGFVQPLRVDLPAAPTQWAPEFPDLLNRPVWRRPNQLSPELFPTTVVTFGWKVTFPDKIDRKLIDPGALTQSVLGLQAIGTTKIEWRPTYPDLHGRAGFPSQFQQTLVQNLDPIPNPPSPDLAWRPAYQDWIATPSRLTWFASTFGDPRIMPPSPDLAWRVTAPDLIARVLMPVAAVPTEFFQQRVFQPDLRMDWQATVSVPVRRQTGPEGLATRAPDVPVSPVVWLTQRLDPPRPAPRPVTFGGATAPAALVVIGSNLGWQAAPADLRRLPIQIVDASASSAVTQPVAPSPSTWCVMFSDDAIIAPALEPEIMGLPALADEMVRTPQLHSEQVC